MLAGEVDAEDELVVKNIPMNMLSMLAEQGHAILRDIELGKTSRTSGLPELFYNTKDKQLIVDDGNHRIFQRWLAGHNTFDAIIYSGEWSESLRSVYDGEDKFDWSEHYRTNDLLNEAEQRTEEVPDFISNYKLVNWKEGVDALRMVAGHTMGSHVMPGNSKRRTWLKGDIDLSALRTTGTDYDKVQRYTDTLKGALESGTIDPIFVEVDKGEVIIADGNHRIRAAKTLGIKTLPGYLALDEIRSKRIRQLTEEAKFVKIYRALPASASTIRPGDYVTMGRKFATEHAVTSAIYNDEPFAVVMKMVPAEHVVPADNPGEYRWGGEEIKVRALLIADTDGNVTRAGLREEVPPKKSKTAVIIKGNPEFLKGREGFYNEIKEFLEGLGYSVKLDAGAAHTTPPKADLWIGHSRGADRLEDAKPDHAKEVLGIGVPDGNNPFPVINHDDDKPVAGQTPSDSHFVFTDKMRDKIKEFDKTLHEERIKKNSKGADLFQMGSSLPDELYNKKNGKPSREPGIGSKK